MKIPSFIFGTVAAACVMGAALPQPASAQVSADDFNALKKVVEQLGEKVQKLEQTHEQDQKTHEQDQQVIQQLQQQLGETKTAVTNAQQTADSVAKAQAANPAVNASPGPMHNFTMVGDAEVQFGKTSGQHGAFTLADFAPIFLFRASDDVLFEAGFDIMLNNNADPANGLQASSTSVSLSFATLDYLLNDYMTLVAGEMLLPLGTYSERGAGWLNKIPDDPLVRDDLLPADGMGVQLRGAVPVGESGQMVSYSVYGVNGPSSGTGTATAKPAPGSCRQCRRCGAIGTPIPAAADAWAGFTPGNLTMISNWAYQARPANGAIPGTARGRLAWWMRPCTWARTLKSRASISIPGWKRTTWKASARRLVGSGGLQAGRPESGNALHKQCRIGQPL